MKKLIPVILAFAILTVPITAQTDYSLEDYPHPFVESGVFNAQIVVGQNAATSDMIGAVDIAASLVAESKTDIGLKRIPSLFDTHVGVMDVNAPELGSKPMIVVGGPCINAVSAKLMGYPQPCNKGFEVGKATIRYYPHDKALLIAGYEAQETLSASYVLADHEDYELSGNEAEVNIIGQGVLDIRQVR